jgi:DNA-binding CsgD family transcriptional regulator
MTRAHRIPALHAQGLTSPQIADQLGITRQWADVLTKSQGLTPHPAQKPNGQGRRSVPREEHQRAITQRIAQRRQRVAATLKREPAIPSKAIASILGVSVWTIQNDIRAMRHEGERG